MTLPVRRIAAGGEQGQACTLPVSLIEESGQQALGLTQGLVATGRGRSVDNHQPQFMSAGRALLPTQVPALPWTALEQSRRPGHRALRCLAGTPALALFDRPWTGPGIRHQ